MEILFVCRQNLERSPMAEYMASQIAAKRGLDIKISSAGLETPIYSYIPDEVSETVKRLGYPGPIRHTPRRVSTKIDSFKDFVFCFEDSDVLDLKRILGENQPIYNLKSYIGESGQILSPQYYFRDNALSATIMHLPWLLKHPLFPVVGYVHRQDIPLVQAIMDQTARGIERGVKLALNRIYKES